ncbi:MAG TPA: FAD-dependent oxidoreductase [Rhizomicrobium sp.]|jgi:glycine/D-amino acid oxidase-like deaminating enzyme
MERFAHLGPLDRRRMLQGSLALGGFAASGLAGCAELGGRHQAQLSLTDQVPPLAPIRARLDRLFDITVCLRPFRAAGPRIEPEQIGDTRVIHNYGHGGSGWSLSWGSSTLAVRMAMQSSPRGIAVVGCGALGLTSAILAQGAGAKVTIYARDLLPQTRSARATGSWTPDSRIALASVAGPAFGERWEEMARISFKTYRSYLGLPGDPVEWTDRYYLNDALPGATPSPPAPGALDFANYQDRVRDIMPKAEVLPPGSTPFPAPVVRRATQMQFNIADYGHTLMSDFLAAGGTFRRAEFHAPSDLAALREKVVINCPGYGARELMKDESIVPVRGQIGWLIPQPEVHYGLYYDGVSVVARRDGIVVQMLEGGDMSGYNDANETVDRAESETAVGRLAELYERMAKAG